MIEETVAKIEAALREARGAEPEKRAQLIALLEQLKAEVQREKASKDIIAKAEEGLKDAAVEFDATHPKLAAIIGEVSAMLAKIGI